MLPSEILEKRYKTMEYKEAIYVIAFLHVRGQGHPHAVRNSLFIAL